MSINWVAKLFYEKKIQYWSRVIFSDIYISIHGMTAVNRVCQTLHCTKKEMFKRSFLLREFGIWNKSVEKMCLMFSRSRAQKQATTRLRNIFFQILYHSQNGGQYNFILFHAQFFWRIERKNSLVWNEKKKQTNVCSWMQNVSGLFFIVNLEAFLASFFDTKSTNKPTKRMERKRERERWNFARGQRAA